MNLNKLIGIVALLSLISTSCAQQVNITFLQMNDVYEMSPVSGGKYGGLSRVATVIDSLEKRNENTFSVLAGDLLSPSAIGTVPYENGTLSGYQMIDVLNHMGLDYFTIGNHEFDLKQEALFRERLEQMKWTTITDNVLDLNGQMFKNTETHQIVNVQGVKIGFFGVTLNSFDVKYANISDPFQKARESIDDLKKNGADIIIGITHQSISEDIKFAADFPEIDLIMGGHEHENFNLLRGDNFTPITKADANAKTVFIHQLVFDKKTRELRITSELKFINETIESDPKIEEVVQKWTDFAFEEFRKNGIEPLNKICAIDEIMDGTEASVRSKATNLTSLICRGFMTAFPTADAAIMNGGSIRIDDKLQPCPAVITEYDILKISPFGGNVVLASIKGDTLIAALNQGVDNVGMGSFLQHANITGSKGSWKIGGEAVKGDKMYKIAISEYLVKNGDQNLGMLVAKEGDDSVVILDDSPQEFVKVVIQEFKKEYPSTECK